MEREKAALTKAWRELAQLRLSTLRGEMVPVNETARALKASCLRIRSRLQAVVRDDNGEADTSSSEV